MATLHTIQDLAQLREQCQQALTARGQGRAVIFVGAGTCGIAAGARETMQAIQQELDLRKLMVPVTSVGCIGMCAKEPLVDIQINGGSHVFYANIQPDMAPRLIEEHVVNGRPVREWAICRMSETEPPADEPQAIQNVPQFRDLPFTGKQIRIALSNCGIIDPEKIEEYIARDGYRALARALADVVARGSHSRNQRIRPARSRRRGILDRHEMGTVPEIAR